MPTLAVGSNVELFFPVASDITVTITSPGRVSVNGRNRDGSAIAPRELYATETLTVAAGGVLLLEAIGLDCDYTAPSTGGASGTANAVAVLDAGLSQINVICDSANTNYEAYNIALNAANAPAECVIEVAFQVHWTGLVASTKTMLVGIGRSFTNAMTGSASNPDGALILSRTNGATQNTSEFKVGVQIGTNRDAQVFLMATTGDENTGTSSALPVGVVTLSANDCKLYIGLKSATAGEVLRLSSCRVTRITVPA